MNAANARRADFGQQLRFAGIGKRAREQQGASVVVDTIAVSAVRHRMDGVLKHAGIVAEREEMADPHLRNGSTLAHGTTAASGSAFSGLLACAVSKTAR